METKEQKTYWDKDGRRLSVDEWSVLFEDRAYCVVADTEIDGQLVRAMWDGEDDGVGVACMWHIGIQDRAGAWSRVWEGYHPCTQAEALEMHGKIVAVLGRAETAEYHTVNGVRYLCHKDDHYCPKD